MKFKMPTSCRIGGTTYRIVREAMKDHNLYGQTVHSQCLMKLDPEVAQARQHETLIHETLHIIDDIYDCHLKESQVSRLTHGLYEFIQQLEVDDAVEER